MAETMTFHPAGTLVVGRWDDGKPVKFGCETHIFRLVSDAHLDEVYDEIGPMWFQIAQCLVCDYTVTLNARAFVHQATQDDISRCIAGIETEVRRLNLCIADLADRSLTRAVVLDLDPD